MALWPNGSAYWHAPARLAAGREAGLSHFAINTMAGGRFGITDNGQMAKTSSVPEGYAPQAHTLPRTAGGMVGAFVAEVTGAGSLISGSTLGGSFAVTMTTSANLALITALDGTWTASFSTTPADLALTLGLTGAWTAELTASGQLAIIDPMTGSFTVSFDATGDLKGRLALTGEFSTSDVPVIVDYGGAIYVSEWGTDGFSYPSGTATFPVATMACADYLATKYNLRKYYISGVHTLLKAYDHTEFQGWGPRNFCEVNLNNQFVDQCLFKDLTVLGQLNTTTVGGIGWQANVAKVQFDTCLLEEMIDLQGNVEGCTIDGPTTIAAGGWLSGSGIVIDGDFTVLDLQSTTGTTLSLDIASGWTQVANSVDGCLVELNVKGGEVSFLDSCTGGDYYLEGVGTLFMEGTGMVKKENHFIWDEDASYVNTAGSTGAKLNSAGAASNPWDTPEGQGLVLKTDEVWKLHGLKMGAAVTVTPTSRQTEGIAQTISGDGTTTSTVERAT